MSIVQELSWKYKINIENEHIDGKRKNDLFQNKQNSFPTEVFTIFIICTYMKIPELLCNWQDKLPYLKILPHEG